MKLYLLTLFLFNLIFLVFHKRISAIFNIYDKPDNLRKFHTNITPVTGGLLVFCNLIIYILFYLFSYKNDPFIDHFFNDVADFSIFILTCVCFFLLGIFDDKINISSNKKFLLLIIIILPSLLILDDLIVQNVRLTFINEVYDLKNFSIIWTILCFLLFINAFNMFDGINLQSAIYTLSLSSFLIIFLGADQLVLTIIISILSFMYLNYQSKSFFGDGGTLLLSYIFGFLFIRSYNLNTDIYADQIVLIMILPGLELIRLFVSRIVNKKNPFSADRNHLHHMLLKKFGLFQVNLIIQSLIIIPFILSLVFGFTLWFIIMVLFIYSFLVFRYI
jgi:UDP-GlcNAc:undecaprenyl-phosphate/decaprenyl-phosphate GlcNAc-1-phosphate transferase